MEQVGESVHIAAQACAHPSSTHTSFDTRIPERQVARKKSAHKLYVCIDVLGTSPGRLRRFAPSTSGYVGSVRPQRSHVPTSTFLQHGCAQKLLSECRSVYHRVRHIACARGCFAAPTCGHVGVACLRDLTSTQNRAGSDAAAIASSLRLHNDSVHVLAVVHNERFTWFESVDEVDHHHSLRYSWNMVMGSSWVQSIHLGSPLFLIAVVVASCKIDNDLQLQVGGRRRAVPRIQSAVQYCYSSARKHEYERRGRTAMTAIRIVVTSIFP